MSSPTDVASSYIFTSKNFLIWRGIWSLYFWHIVIGIQIYNRGSIVIFKFLTIWVLLLCTFYFTLSFCCSYFYKKHSLADHLRLCRWAKTLQTLSVTLAWTVVVSFWSLFWKYADWSDPFGYQVHGVTAIITLADCYVSSTHMCFRSTWWYFILFGAVYGAFSVCYSFLFGGGTYPVMEWKEAPIVAAVCLVGVLALTLVLHAVVCWVNNKLLPAKDTSDSDNCDEEVAHLPMSHLGKTFNSNVDLPAQTVRQSSAEDYEFEAPQWV